MDEKVIFWIPFCQLAVMTCWVFYWDMKCYRIPNALTCGGWIAGLTFCLLFSRSDTVFFLAGSFSALAVFLPVYLIFPGKMGGGDVKLAVVIGALSGPFRWWVAHYTAVGLGILFFLLLRRSGAKARPLPFGPFLCLGGLVSLFPLREVLQ